MAMMLCMVCRLTLIAILLAGPLLAQGPPPTSSLTVGPGLLARQKAWKGANVELIPIPWIDARFGRWTVRGLRAEYDLGSRGPLRLAATANARLGGVEPRDFEPRLEILDRDPTLELGFGASIPFGRWQFGAEASADILGVHGGYEAALRAARFIQQGRLIVVPSAGVRYWSPELAAFDYGLEAGEAGFIDGYDPGGAIIPQLSVAATYFLSPKWSVIGFGQVSRLDDGIVGSPLVDSRSESLLGVGLGYRLR